MVTSGLNPETIDKYRQVSIDVGTILFQLKSTVIASIEYLY